MKMKMRFTLTTMAAILLTITSALVAQAQHRTFVASTGNDANPACTRAAPCRNYQAAINAAFDGGEVVPLDSAGYGTISIINKSITINVPGGIYAGVSATSGTAVSVSLSPSNVVILSGLQINGNNTATNGISVAGSGKVNVRECDVTRFAGKGILVTGGEVNVENSTIIGNGSGIRAENQGPDLDSGTNGITPRVTVVRISNGMIADNTTAFEMVNPGGAGTRPQGQCNARNIFIRDSNGLGNGQPNIVGNPTFLSVTGVSDFNAGCQAGSVAIGTYGSQSQNGESTANQ